MLFLLYRYGNIAGASDQCFQNRITATILKDLPKLLQLLEEHPLKAYGSDVTECFSRNRFLQRLYVAAKDARIEKPIEKFLEWSIIIEKDFHLRNFSQVTMQDLKRTQGEEHRELVNTRTIAGFMTTVAQVTSSNDARLHCLENNSREQMGLMRTLLEQNDKLLQQIAVLKQHVVQGQGEDSAVVGGGAARPLANNNNDSIVVFLPPSLTGLSVVDVFISWHTEGYYKLLIGSNESKSMKANRGTVKFCIEYLSLFHDQQVSPLPSGVRAGCPGSQGWEAQLRKQAEAAWEKVKVFWVQHGGVPKMSTSVTTFKNFMNMDHTLWPIGPSEPTPFQPPTSGRRGRRMYTRADLVTHQENIRKQRTAKTEKQSHAEVS